MNDSSWPNSQVFHTFSRSEQLTDGFVICSGIAVCDAEGHSVKVFRQGQSAHFYYEFEVLGEIGIPIGGLEFRDGAGDVIHGKNSIQYGAPAIDSVQPGTYLRFHHIISLEVASGKYVFTVGLASCPEVSYAGYLDGPMTHEEFIRSTREHCRVVNAGSFTVEYACGNKLLHHGKANLPGDCRMRTVHNNSPVTNSVHKERPHGSEDNTPAIFHVTHWKAGSQWIHKILVECVPDRVIAPMVGESQFLHWPLECGKVYPTVYVTKQQFDRAHLPDRWRRFVMIRDLRDTLISAYFSFKVSHPIIDSQLAKWRETLNSLNTEAGLIYLISVWLPNCANIQHSWLTAGERLIHYEDLLEGDLEILEQVLLKECELPIS